MAQEHTPRWTEIRKIGFDIAECIEEEAAAETTEAAIDLLQKLFYERLEHSSRQQQRHIKALEALGAENAKLRGVLTDLHAFVSIMVGHGADAVIPETINTPLGVPVKIGAIMRDAVAALSEGK